MDKMCQGIEMPGVGPDRHKKSLNLGIMLTFQFVLKKRDILERTPPFDLSFPISLFECVS
jgi:hypothetical protein